MPCCASPPTATHRQTHTHPAPCVDSHILYSSTLTHVECVLSNSQPDECEGKTESGCGGGGGWGGLKVKEAERENLESEVYIHAENTHLHDYMDLCIYVFWAV